MVKQNTAWLQANYVFYSLKNYFLSAKQPYGSSKQDDSYVTAQALPFGKRNKTKQTWVSFELPNCLTHSLHEPRQMHHGRLESAAHP